MTKTVKDYLAEADAAVERIGVDAARQMIAQGALVVDVRDGTEVAASGRVRGAMHVSRGLLEFKADTTAPSHDPAFALDRPVLLYCALGVRSAMAGKVLKDMGYKTVYNLGGYKDWVAAGGEVDPAG